MPVSADSIYSGGGNSQNGEHLEQIPEPLVSLDPQQRRLLVPYKKTCVSGATTVRYKECLKNHAAAMGGNAMDGCGEFMPSGEEGTLEALKCSACFCHRNFHRKEVEGEQQYCSSYKGVINVGAPDSCYYSAGCPTAVGGLNVSPKAAVLPQQMIMAYNKGAAGSAASDDLSDEHGVLQQLGRSGSGGDHEHNQRSMVMKKRFRTKFTPEQKEKMLAFAERAGWKIQKQEEAVVQQFCQELGIKRRVLKVWMHNNKHNYAFKKNSPIITSDHN